jgi:hypothetical protein
VYFFVIFLNQVTYRFRVLLPEHLHPSYGRGTGARFFYMVTVTVGSKHQHIPLAVLSKGFLGQQALSLLCMPHLPGPGPYMYKKALSLHEPAILHRFSTQLSDFISYLCV